jgi:hypothetical protein
MFEQTEIIAVFYFLLQSDIENNSVWDRSVRMPSGCNSGRQSAHYSSAKNQSRLTSAATGAGFKI